MNKNAPLYVQLKEEIISAIQDGKYKPGDLLPSQRSIADSHDMSHMTVRRAINELINEGVIYSIQGKGIYVAQQKVASEYGSLQGLDQQLDRLGMKPSTRILEAKTIAASTMLAQTLEIEPSMPVIYLHRLRYADEKPISLHTVFLPAQLVPNILEKETLQHSLFQTLREEYGLTLAGSSNSVSAEIANQEVSELLGLEYPTAIIVREQITYLDTGQVIEYSRTWTRGDIYHVRYEEGIVPK
jgi:GntR family transcriptional regulator